MSDSATADATSAPNQATPEQTSWLRSFLGSGDPQKPNFFDQASSAVSGAVGQVEDTAKELYHEAGAAVDKVEGKAKQFFGEAGSAIKKIPQKVSEAGDEVADWGKRTFGASEGKHGDYKSPEQEEKERKEAIAEVQRREQLRTEAENDYWKKVCEEQNERMRNKQQADAERKQREEADRKAMQEEYDDIRRRLQPVTAGVDPTPHPRRKH